MPELHQTVKFISHNETDVLLWMTKPAGPFDSTLKMWDACIDKLIEQGYVERTGNGSNAVSVTAAGEARAKELRGA